MRYTSTVSLSSYFAFSSKLAFNNKSIASLYLAIEEKERKRERCLQVIIPLLAKRYLTPRLALISIATYKTHLITDISQKSQPASIVEVLFIHTFCIMCQLLIGQ